MRRILSTLVPHGRAAGSLPQARDAVLSGAGRALSSYSRAATLRRAETAANGRPDDPVAQAEYLSHLNGSRMHTEVGANQSSTKE